MQYHVKKTSIVFQIVSFKHTQLLFIFLILGVAFPAAASAATYYVNPSTGSDRYSGTSESPWKTPAWASTQAANGSTVYLASGNYGDVIFGTQPSRTDWSQAVSFEAASGATPIFTYIKFNRLANAYISVKGVTVNPIDMGTSTYDRAIDIYDSSHVKIINCTVNGVWKTSIEAGLTNYGVQVRYSSMAMSDILVEGCEFKDLQRGIDLFGVIRDGVIFRNNHIYHTAGGGIVISPNNADSGLMVIEGNHIHYQKSVLEGSGNTHGTGIAIRANNLLVRGNIIHDCGNTRGIRTYQGVFPDVGYTNLTFENNLVYDTINDLPVEFVDLGTNIKFNNNTIIGHYSTSSQAKYKYGSSATFLAATQSNGSSISFYNNVFVGYVSVDGALTNYAENNNIIWSAIINGVWKSSLKGSRTKILCYDGYTYDLNLFENPGRFFVGSPLFDQYSYTVSRDSSGNNTPHGVDLNTAYKLASGALAIGFGDASKAPTTDITGGLRGSTIDDGCYEFATSGDPAPVNQAPIFSDIGSQTISVGSQLSFVLNATDPDGDTITYSASNLPSGAKLTGDTFTWIPTSAQQGTYAVTFTASDGELSANPQVVITVTGANHAPIVGPVSPNPQTISADSLCTFTVPVSDPDGDTLLSAATFLPSGATFSDGNFKWTPTSSQVGTYTVGFYANDGSLTTTYNVMITVTGTPTVTDTPTTVVIIDNASRNTASSGRWHKSIAANAYGGRSVSGYNGATYTWYFMPKTTGTYRVSMWWTAISTRSTSVPVKITHSGGTASVSIDQTANSGMWNTLDQYTFNAGTIYKVVLAAPSGDWWLSACADAVKFEEL